MVQQHAKWGEGGGGRGGKAACKMGGACCSGMAVEIDQGGGQQRHNDVCFLHRQYDTMPYHRHLTIHTSILAV